MWKNLISSITGITGGIYIYLIVAAVSGAVFGYVAYSWTSDYYVAKIERANLEVEKEKVAIQQKGDKLVADYVSTIQQLGSVNANLQKQINNQSVQTIYVTKDNGSHVCGVSNGFVRLYNASALGEDSTPSGSDAAPSSVDLATVLSVAAENNAKYLQVTEQLKDLQKFLNNN
jgi:hypothetical protein